MRVHRLALLLALTGCATGSTCELAGCVSQLTVRLPAGVTEATACVAEVCTSRVVEGVLQVPLSRRTDTTTAAVTVTVPGAAEPYEGVVPVERTSPGQGCPAECVNGDAVVDDQRGQVVPAGETDEGAG